MLKFLFNLKTTFFRLFEWVRVILRYYIKSWRFFWVDCLMAAHYLRKSPHQISKEFLKQCGAANIYAYGETPLTTLDRMATEFGILSHDIFYEMGCGSARGCFWINLFVKCRVIGIDYLPTFIRKAAEIKKSMGLYHIDFLEEEMVSTNLSRATVIYLYGTCLDDATIKKLIYNFAQLRSGTKIITVSYPLEWYCDPDLFKVIKQFRGRFPWGKADLFLNVKN